MNNATIADTCWVISDGRAGLLNQCLGLAEAVGLPIEVKTVNPRAPWTWLPVTMWGDPRRALKADGAKFEPPWPRLAIGCGWRSIPFMLWLKHWSGGKTLTVQLQDPRVALAHFDLVVPPEHDELRGANVVAMLGSPNRITRATLEEAAAKWRPRFEALPHPRVGVLIGGKSKAHRFAEKDAAQMAAQLKQLADGGASLIVTPSRRTGTEQSRIIADALKGTSAFVWDGIGENPYFAILALSDAFLVTSDSTNLLTEAAATGKPVHIVAVPGGTAKFARLHQSLLDRGMARRFTGKIESWSYPPLNETARVAGEIKRRLAARAG